MATPLQSFLASLDSSDRQFAEDYDTAAARRLTGEDRHRAIDALVVILDRGVDPRSARCLGAMGASEAATELFIAASTGEPTLRMEAALAHRRVAGEGPLVATTARAVLAKGTPNAQQLAVQALAAVGERDALRDTALHHPLAGVRGSAFAAWLPEPMVHQGRSHALSQRITAGPPELAAACAPELDRFDPGQDIAADTRSAPFPALRQRLIDGTLDASDLTQVGASERALLIAWAAWDLGEKLDTAPQVALAVELPGAREALEGMLGEAEGSFREAVARALDSC